MYWFIIKDTKEQPGRKVCGARSGRVLSWELLLVELVCATLPASGCQVYQPRRFLKLLFKTVFF